MGDLPSSAFDLIDESVVPRNKIIIIATMFYKYVVNNFTLNLLQIDKYLD